MRSSTGNSVMAPAATPTSSCEIQKETRMTKATRSSSPTVELAMPIHIIPRLDRLVMSTTGLFPSSAVTA